jgi:hypothetical protein
MRGTALERGVNVNRVPIKPETGIDSRNKYYHSSC